jgi:hypothetical protein
MLGEKNIKSSQPSTGGKKKGTSPAMQIKSLECSSQEIFCCEGTRRDKTNRARKRLDRRGVPGGGGGISLKAEERKATSKDKLSLVSVEVG